MLESINKHTRVVFFFFFFCTRVARVRNRNMLKPVSSENACRDFMVALLQIWFVSKDRA